jgi:hypothetical protein
MRRHEAEQPLRRRGEAESQSGLLGKDHKPKMCSNLSNCTCCVSITARGYFQFLFIYCIISVEKRLERKHATSHLYGSNAGGGAVELVS